MGDWNCYHSLRTIERQDVKAESVGLGTPTKIVLNSFANATSAVLSYEREQNKTRAMTMAAVQALAHVQRRFLLTSDMHTPSSGPSAAEASSDEDEIMYNDEDVLGT